MTQAGGPTRRDIVRAAGLGIGAALTAGPALAVVPAVPDDATLWSHDYWARKGDVSLSLSSRDHKTRSVRLLWGN